MPTKTTTPKSPVRTSPRVARPKPVQSADGADPVEGGAEGAGKGANGLRLKWLVDQVVASTGVKKKGVKEVVEATLVQMGTALKAGETLNLPGLGKMRVVRQPAEEGGALTLKLRQPTPGTGKENSDAEPIADDADQD